jgi:hypothetical protein
MKPKIQIEKEKQMVEDYISFKAICVNAGIFSIDEIIKLWKICSSE